MVEDGAVALVARPGAWLGFKSSQRVFDRLYSKSITAPEAGISPAKRADPPSLVIVRVVNPSGVKVGVVDELAADAITATRVLSAKEISGSKSAVIALPVPAADAIWTPESEEIQASLALFLRLSLLVDVSNHHIFGKVVAGAVAPAFKVTIACKALFRSALKVAPGLFSKT